MAILVAAAHVAPAAHLRADSTVQDLLDHPAFAGFARLLLPWDDRTYDGRLPLRDLGTLLPYQRPPGAVTGPAAAALTNPVPATPASIAAGKAAYDATCAACHGDRAQGAVKAKLTISIIEEQGGKQPPDLTDAQSDHGSSDGEIYAVLKRGLPPTMMPGFDGAVSDENLWSIVNYLRTLAAAR